MWHDPYENWRSERMTQSAEVVVGDDDWVLMKGDDVIASDPDPDKLIEEYHKYPDGEVMIAKNLKGQYLYY